MKKDKMTKMFFTKDSALLVKKHVFFFDYVSSTSVVVRDDRGLRRKPTSINVNYLQIYS